MQYRVPQFIEHEPAFIGPFTAKQILFVLVPGGISLLLYLTLAEKNFAFVIVAAIFLIGGGLALAFIKIQGHPLPTVLINYFKYIMKPQKYFWQKGEKPIVTFEIKKYEFKKSKEPKFQFLESSKLKKARIKVETQTKG